jgi:hypothetical protein
VTNSPIRPGIEVEGIQKLHIEQVLRHSREKSIKKPCIYVYDEYLWVTQHRNMQALRQMNV